MVLVAIGSASAAPNTTTVTLSCDRGVGVAEATVELQASIFDPPFDTVVLSCGPDSTSGLKRDVEKVTTGAAGFASFEISLTNAQGSGGCFGGTTVTASVSCDPNDGPGVKLVVR
jgi:hypothetical protein